MENLAATPLGAIVKKNYKTAEVFENFGLDFCCMGTQTLEEACTASNIEMNKVIIALNEIKANESDDVNFDMWPLNLLADYIYQRHHKYIETKTPIIKSYLEKICLVHGNKHPELLEIKKIFDETSGELAVHMKKEELMLFPYIKRLVHARENNTTVKSPVFYSVAAPITAMKNDHTNEGEQLQRIAKLSNNFAPPADACSTYQVTYQLLKEYEKDLHVHIHLENNILFEKAIHLEEELQ